MELKLACLYGGQVSGVERWLKLKEWRRKGSSSERRK